MKIKGVLFDLDGVLVDATEWHYDALNRALGLFGYTINRYEHLTTYNGLPTRRKLEILAVEKGFPQGLSGLVNKIKQKYTREEILRRCTPVFEKEFMLHQLKRDGFKLAVCSNSIRDSVELMLHGSGIATLFDSILCSDDVAQPKPHPEMYLRTCELFGIAPEEAIIVEDAPHGLEAARRCGAIVCQVSSFEEVDYTRIRRAIDLA